MEVEKRPWLWGGQWSSPRQMGWGVHVLEELVLRRSHWVLRVGVVVSHFAAMKAETQMCREGPQAQCPRCECCCQASDHREFSVPFAVTTIPYPLPPSAPIGGECLW